MVQVAYRGLLMTGRYPVAFLFLVVPPEPVDVNVHPTRAEVRFRNKDRLYQLVQQAVSPRLEEADLIVPIKKVILAKIVAGSLAFHLGGRSAPIIRRSTQTV